MNSSPSPIEHDVFLAGVKAKAYGWPAASLDPGSGPTSNAASESPLSRSQQVTSPRFQEIAEG